MFITVPLPESLPNSQNSIPDEVYLNVLAGEQLTSIVRYMLSYTNEFHKTGRFEITLTNTGCSEVRNKVTKVLASRGWQAMYELEKYQQPLLTLLPIIDDQRNV